MIVMVASWNQYDIPLVCLPFRCISVELYFCTLFTLSLVFLGVLQREVKTSTMQKNVGLHESCTVA